jgi:hypothetical protein
VEARHAHLLESQIAATAKSRIRAGEFLAHGFSTMPGLSTEWDARASGSLFVSNARNCRYRPRGAGSLFVAEGPAIGAER